MFSENKGILGFFQKQEEPRELIRKWQRSLRAECRVIERQIREVEREQMKVKRSIKEAAKRQDIASCRILAKEVVASKKAVTRMYTNRAHMMSMSSALSEQLAVARVAKVLEQSTVVMKLVTELVRVPELNQQMQELAKEMMKAGLIQEMTDELLDDALDQDDLEEETEAEVDAILSELAGASVAEMPDASNVRRTEQSQSIAHDEDVAVEEPAPALNQLAS